MKKSKEQLRKIAKKIWNLERECQAGNNISSNIKEMESLSSQLDLEELLYIAAYLEETT